MIAFCNAKINIGLRVLGRRTDGFHDLQSYFLPIPIRDALEIIHGTQEGLLISASGVQIPDKGNICAMAYGLLNKEFDLPDLELHLLKTIPVGAGLGGGSSNAAAMLNLLNDSLTLGICDSDLLKFAEQLGSDVPFFIKNKACLVSGRGEMMEPFEVDLKGFWMQIVNPGIHCSTAEIFSKHRIDPSTEDLKTALKRPMNEWHDHVFNDLEKIAFDLYPEIASLKESQYQKSALYAAMSGSGSSVFSIYKEEPEPHHKYKSWEFQL